MYRLSRVEYFPSDNSQLSSITSEYKDHHGCGKISFRKVQKEKKVHEFKREMEVMRVRTGDLVSLTNV